MPAKKTSKAKSKRKPVSLPERPRLAKNLFQPGNRAAADRGANKLTQDIKQGIVGAATKIGYDGQGLGGLEGYCMMLAEDYPKQFASLLGRVLPLQINATPGAFIGSVNIVGVPSGMYMTAEQMKALQPPDEPPIVDGVQVFEPEPEGEEVA